MSNTILTQTIQTAIKNNKIVPFYQVIRRKDDEINQYTKFEVLARINDTFEEASKPFIFIEIAKKLNLYHEIQQQIIEKSLQDILEFKKTNSNLKFSINIQMDDINNDQTIQFLEDKLKCSGLAQNIVFELSEEDALTEAKGKKTKQFIEKFKQIGCEFALDDFGTGYSSFHPLIEFEFDYLKFDKVLVENLYKEPKKYYICDMLVEFSKRTNLKVIAEYV